MSRNYFFILAVVGAIGLPASIYFLNSVLPLPLAKADEAASETGIQTWVIFGSAVVAFFALVGTSYHNERTHKINNTLNTLQNLRRDRDYLDRARIVKQFVGGDFSKPISAQMLVALKNERPTSTGTAGSDARPPSSEITVIEALNFVLNQYEFIAGANSAGAPPKRKKDSCHF